MDIQTKEIGISLGVDKGTFYNTEFISGKLQLKKVGETSSLQPIYAKKGSWESEVIDLVDKFHEYDRIVVSKSQLTLDFYEMYTRMSEDGITFSDYKITATDGTIQSPPFRYVQVLINFEAGMIEDTIFISDFNNTSDVDDWELNTYVQTNGVLKLKRNYVFDMTQDSLWTESGSLFRKSIMRNEWKKIDSLGVE